MHTPPRRTSLVLATIVALVGLVGLTGLAGCSGSDDSGGSGGSGDADAEAPAAVPAGDDAADAADANGSAGSTGSAGSAPAVISTGTVSLEAEDVARARLRVRAVADAHQGTIGEQETTTGEKGELTTARLVLRVPSDRFDDVVSALEEVATPTGTTTNGEDVTAEVVDVDARIRAQRKSVARIEALLARAASIEQIVAIEAQLASRQGDLDALESRQRWLADQTSMSTVSVYIERSSSRDEPDEDTADGFLGGLAKGWDAFVDGLGTVLVVVGFLVPWLALVALIGVPAWLVARRRPRGRAGAA
ncbi:DUF4349 domain-containing protein [Nocardioides sp. BYT-33-1]|uniref:DUF4349 domain-containing protein n=1 Tax=Nocardioides sp. BYT-33-1 TaxID=3416952 RepID=UPI003F53885A